MHKDEKEREVETKPAPSPAPAAEPADPAKPLMARLERVVGALEEALAAPTSGFPLAELQAEERITPTTWEDIAFHGKRPVPGWIVALLAANAFVDACLLKCKGTMPLYASELASRLLDEQREHGVFRVHEKDDPSGHLSEWDAAMAAILYVAHVGEYGLIKERAAPWWRQMLDTDNPGGGRFESFDVWLFIDHGERVADPSLAARFFYLMENVELPKPAVPWKVVV